MYLHSKQNYVNNDTYEYIHTYVHSYVHISIISSIAGAQCIFGHMMTKITYVCTHSISIYVATRVCLQQCCYVRMYMHSHYLYKCNYLIPIHIHSCKCRKSFQQYYYRFDCTLLILQRTHQYLNKRLAHYTYQHTVCTYVHLSHVAINISRWSQNAIQLATCQQEQNVVNTIKSYGTDLMQRRTRE